MLNCCVVVEGGCKSFGGGSSIQPIRGGPEVSARCGDSDEPYSVRFNTSQLNKRPVSQDLTILLSKKQAGV